MILSRQFESHWELEQFLNNEYIKKEQIVQITHGHVLGDWASRDMFTVFWEE